VEPIEYLKILQQRWRLIVGCALLAMVVGYLLAPSAPGSSAAPTSMYKADVIMVTNPDVAQPLNLGLAALYTTHSTDVAEIAAKALNYSGDPMDLAANVTATPDTGLGVLTVSSTDSDQKRAVDQSTAFANATSEFFATQAAKRQAETAASASAQIKQLNEKIKDLTRRVDSGDTAAQTELTGAQGALLIASQQLNQAQLAGTQAKALTELGKPTVTMVSSGGGGISAPSSRTGRMLLVGLVGLGLGLLAALVLERLDTRLRTSAAIGAAFGLPVIAEIPKASRHLRHHEVAVVSDPAGGLAESYRALRSALLLMAAPRTRTEGGSAMVGRRGAPHVLLVTSPRAGDGKSSTVANLAAALAEAGRSVLVLDCDFRNPEAHRYLDVQPGIGLSDLLAAGEAADLGAAIRPTAIPHVRVITAGTAASNPASLLLRIGTVIEKARAHADVILLDSAPMLTINDTTDLVQHADAVLVVCRSGRINNEQAARVTQLLSRASTPVVGIAVVGIAAASVGRGGHRAGGSSTLRNQPYRPFPTSARPTVVNRTRVRVGRWVRQIGRRDPLDALDPYGANRPQPAPPRPPERPEPARRRVAERSGTTGAARLASLDRRPDSARLVNPGGPVSGGSSAGNNSNSTSNNDRNSDRNNGSGSGTASSQGQYNRADGSANPAPWVVPTSRPRGPIPPHHRGKPGGRG
jgi:capsular exopolysaccharide synthesis family protein